MGKLIFGGGGHLRSRWREHRFKDSARQLRDWAADAEGLYQARQGAFIKHNQRLLGMLTKRHQISPNFWSDVLRRLKHDICVAED